MIGAGTGRKRPGVQIIGNSRLEKGQKITVALGQKGNTKCGAGGTFVVLDEDENPKPLFVAAGAGYAYDKNFAKGQFTQEASGNAVVGSYGRQQFISDEDRNRSVDCAGSGFNIGPDDALENEGPCQFSLSYPQGLTGGILYDQESELMDKMGGFGGGGACYTAETLEGEKRVYFGAGGGYTGGGTQLTRRGERAPNATVCVGGGGGSFTIDPEAKFDHVYTEYGKCKIQLIS